MKWAVWRYLHDMRLPDLGLTVESEGFIDGVPVLELPSNTEWFFQQAQSAAEGEGLRTWSPWLRW